MTSIMENEAQRKHWMAYAEAKERAEELEQCRLGLTESLNNIREEMDKNARDTRLQYTAAKDAKCMWWMERCGLVRGETEVIFAGEVVTFSHISDDTVSPTAHPKIKPRIYVTSPTTGTMFIGDRWQPYTPGRTLDDIHAMYGEIYEKSKEARVHRQKATNSEEEIDRIKGEAIPAKRIWWEERFGLEPNKTIVRAFNGEEFIYIAIADSSILPTMQEDALPCIRVRRIDGSPAPDLTNWTIVS